MKPLTGLPRGNRGGISLGEIKKKDFVTGKGREIERGTGVFDLGKGEKVSPPEKKKGGRDGSF